MTPRTILITGGGKGLGAAITRAFHAQGDHVLVASRTASSWLSELGERGAFIECDVTDATQLRAAVEKAIAWTGRLDVLINNAGFSGWKKLADADEAFWDKMIATNLKSCFFACQAAAAVLPAGGAIINISSLAGKRGSAHNAVYCAAKFGVNGLTQALAKELGARGIRVNAVCPVYIETEGLEAALLDPAAPPAGLPIAQYLRDFSKGNSALGRMPQADEVAQTCVFLASPAASAITGQCLNVDCGVLPQ